MGKALKQLQVIQCVLEPYSPLGVWRGRVTFFGKRTVASKAALEVRPGARYLAFLSMPQFPHAKWVQKQLSSLVAQTVKKLPSTQVRPRFDRWIEKIPGGRNTALSSILVWETCKE